MDKKRVTIERDIPDIVVIEGVRYSGDVFRGVSLPEGDVLYSIRKDDDGVVRLTEIRNPAEAQSFFVHAQVKKDLAKGENDGL